jgi:hypothetical protein
VTSRVPPDPAEGINTSIPNPARIYNALLGGKDNFPADRAAAHDLLNVAPQATPRRPRESRVPATSRPVPGR